MVVLTLFKTSSNQGGGKKLIPCLDYLETGNLNTIFLPKTQCTSEDAEIVAVCV